MGNFVTSRGQGRKEEEEQENLNRSVSLRVLNQNAQLNRSVSGRVLNQLIRRPHGSPRQVASLVALDRSIADFGFSAGSYLYFLRRFGRGPDSFWSKGKANSLPVLNSKEQNLALQVLNATFQGKKTFW